ncbi:sodium:calcium antiporter [Patescibacteria group bacterium]|nr:sodium:calcium antiporter [Patescibacteria group bacterium]
MVLLHIFIFILSIFLLLWSGPFLVSALMRIAKFLGWKEFVVAFFLIAFAATLPNLFVGLSSAFHGIPQLSFGDVVGGNLIDLTLAIALAVFIAKGLPVESKLAQATSIFTIAIAILPLLLILDGVLGRGDGIILILVFLFYVYWLFSKKERYSKIYDTDGVLAVKEFRVFIRDLGRVMLGIALLLLAAEGIVRTALFFAEQLNLSLALIGILVIALGNSIPETHFAIVSARKGQAGMVLGNLMGSIIVPSTLVLGVVALIHPIEITDFSPFAIARFFLIIAAFFFFFFLRTGHKITRKEGVFLLLIYIAFVLAEILAN